MLHLIPAPLHRLGLRIAYRLRGEWRRRYRRPVHGVSLIARDEHGRVLLVRHSYGSGRWSLPGGGRGTREDPAECVRREMREELRCDLFDLELVRVSHSEIQGAPTIAHVFTARLGGEPEVDGREVLVAQWFAPDDLPGEMVRIARRQIGYLLEARD